MRLSTCYSLVKKTGAASYAFPRPLPHGDDLLCPGRGWLDQSLRPARTTIPMRPEPTTEAPDKPPGLSLSSSPDLSVQSPAEPFEGSLFDALLILSAATPKRPKQGPTSKADEDFVLGFKCLQEKGGREEDARKEFAKRVNPPATYSVASKRFTKNVLKLVRELKLTFFASDKCGSGQN